MVEAVLEVRGLSFRRKHTDPAPGVFRCGIVLGRSRGSDALAVETPECEGGGPNHDQHATGRGTRGSSSSALTGVPGEASAVGLDCDRNVRVTQLQFRLDEHACAARTSAAADRSNSWRRISDSTSIVKKLCIAASVPLHLDSVNRTWQHMICEVRGRGVSRSEPMVLCQPDNRRSIRNTGHVEASAANASGSAPTP
jgi:hypothetical protein